MGAERIIEVGAGTGHLSKALRNQGFAVTAVEPSQGMYKVACEVLSGENVRLLNCSLAEMEPAQSFDLAVSHLVAQTVDDLSSFFVSMQAHLRQGGYLMFSIPHPCFYNSYKRFFGDEYNYMKPMSKEVSFSITKDPENVICGVPYHHRPLADYINTAVASGLVLVRFHEVYPPTEVQEEYGEAWEAPRYCVFVCKKL